ncbi:MAG: glycosyltransferase family 4 protein [Novosphingobium sp.]
MTAPLPALRFEAEAFALGRDRILGRQSAGDAFLRALVALPDLERLIACSPGTGAAQAFAQTLGALRKTVQAGWVAVGAHDKLKQIGALHFPDPIIAPQARGRMAVGSNAYSLTGITHTIASANTMRGITEFAHAPLMEWDGVICTSAAVKASLLEILEEQEEYLAWRLPGARPQPRLQLPVIPLGVHCDDFAFDDAQRREARRALGLGAGDVAFLFVGRLSFHAKANPFPMYAALEHAARHTGKRITLIQCGWFANQAIEDVFKRTAATHAPSVRHIWLDGRNPPERDRAWAAGDVFMSLSDNIQETFGLTPLEAMAAGLPVIVSDWNGYRQTVRHGVNGFMVPTFAPEPPAGEAYAALHAMEAVTYDHYLAMTARHVSMDLAVLFEATTTLASDAHKRRALGAAGRAMARSEFDWSILIRHYLQFWEELRQIRLSVAADDMRCRPRPSAERLDPFRVFRNYPTHAVNDATRLRARGEAGDFNRLIADPLFDQLRRTLPDDALFASLLAAAGKPEGTRLDEAAAAAGIDPVTAQLLASLLLKMGLLTAS